VSGIRNAGNTFMGFAIGYFIIVIVISLCCCCGFVFCIVKLVAATKASKAKKNNISNLYSANTNAAPYGQSATPYYPPPAGGQASASPYPTAGASTYSPPVATPVASTSPYPVANAESSYVPPTGAPAANPSPYAATTYNPPATAYPASSQSPVFPPGNQ
jgi:hypothetical protein